MSTPLVNAIAEATEGDWPEELVDLAAPINLNRARVAAAACIAVVAALPADYTGADILAFLRGEDVPSEPLPAKPPAGFDAEEWDFAVEAFGSAESPRFYLATTPAEVGEEIDERAIAAGEWVTYDHGDGEPSISYLARLHDGRYVYASAWHDYTGWDCQGGADYYIGTRDECLSHMLPNERAQVTA